MAQNYRIYINDNSLLITDVLSSTEDKFQQIDLQEFDFKNFHKGLAEISNKHYVLHVKDVKKAFKSIKKKCAYIKAAGGLVESAAGNYLFIFRNGKWDLPKGKVEHDEKMKEAAVREVEEECGVTVSKREHLLCKTYHVYPYGEKIAFKKTNWYKMHVKGEPNLIPQKEEGIDKAVWLAADAVKPVLKNTFPAILDVLRVGEIIE